jgi:hypothetical protein
MLRVATLTAASAVARASTATFLLEGLGIMAADVATISLELQSLKAVTDIGKALLNLGLNVQVQDRIRNKRDTLGGLREHDCRPRLSIDVAKANRRIGKTYCSA